MRFRYSTTGSTQDEFDSLPRIPLILHYHGRRVEAAGLLDSAATVSVLPYEVGRRLGAVWDERKASVRLAGNLGQHLATPLFVMGEIGEFAPIRLAFAWIRSDNAPLLLGQTNFFMEFEVCFYRAKLEFEVKPKL